MKDFILIPSEHTDPVAVRLSQIMMVTPAGTPEAPGSAIYMIGGQCIISSLQQKQMLRLIGAIHDA